MVPPESLAVIAVRRETRLRVTVDVEQLARGRGDVLAIVAGQAHDAAGAFEDVEGIHLDLDLHLRADRRLDSRWCPTNAANAISRSWPALAATPSRAVRMCRWPVSGPIL